MITVTERINFAKVIQSMVLEEQDDDQLARNIESGEHMLANTDQYQLSEDNVIVLKFWLANYREEQMRRALKIDSLTIN